MFVDGHFHHNQVRKELIDLYEIMTKRLFTIVAPRSVFLSTEQLEVIEKNPPVAGIGLYSTPITTRATIERIINAYLLGGEGFQMAFRYPREEVPIIYETIQDSIRLWVDVKLNSYNYQTVSLKELEAMELVSKSLFSIYQIYYNEHRRKALELKKKDGEPSMADIYINILNHGMNQSDEISFISYVDFYRSRERGDDNFPGNYAKRQLSIDDIPPAQPRWFDEAKESTTLRNWLDD